MVICAKAMRWIIGYAMDAYLFWLDGAFPALRFIFFEIQQKRISLRSGLGNMVHRYAFFELIIMIDFDARYAREADRHTRHACAIRVGLIDIRLKRLLRHPDSPWQFCKKKPRQGLEAVPQRSWVLRKARCPSSRNFVEEEGEPPKPS